MKRRKYPSIEEASIIDKEFFLSGFDLTVEEKETLVGMVASEPFRIFEKYLKRKQNRKAVAMIKAADTEKMLELKAQIIGLGEITADMKLIWEEVKQATKEQDVLETIKKLGLDD